MGTPGRRHQRPRRGARVSPGRQDRRQAGREGRGQVFRSEVEAYITRAFEWGHPAVGISDHGVVHAFPLAAKTADKLAEKAAAKSSDLKWSPTSRGPLNGDTRPSASATTAWCTRFPWPPRPPTSWPRRPRPRLPI